MVEKMEGLRRVKLYTINISQHTYETVFIISCAPPCIFGLSVVYDKNTGIELTGLTILPDVFDLSTLIISNKFNKVWKV